MAVGIRIKFEGLMREQFDEINRHVDPVGDPPTGLLYHASGPIEGGWGVIDFWESRAAFDAFTPRIEASVAAAGWHCKAPRTSRSSPFTRRSPADAVGRVRPARVGVNSLVRVSVPVPTPSELGAPGDHAPGKR